MKRFFSFFLFVILFVTSHAQEVGVPYRVGDKFGISNRAGQIFIAPEFDLVVPRQEDKITYFNCHKFVGNEVLTSLVYQNKIIIKDKKHHFFYREGRFFLGCDYRPKRKYNRVLQDEIDEFQTLYDAKGNRVFTTDYKSISILDALDEKNELNEVLMVTTDMDNLYSMFVYNLKQKKVTRIFFDKSSYLELRYNGEYRPNDNSILVTYKDINNQGMQAVIDLVNNQIKAIETKPFAIKTKNEYADYDTAVEVIDSDFRIVEQPKTSQKRIDQWQSITTKHKFYWELSKPEQIVFRRESIRPENGYLVEENGKMGYYNTGYKKLMVPIQYDEIYKASFSGSNGGYVLRNGSKYGLYIYDHPENKIIAPIFDKIPILVDYDYFKSKDPLIKVYDENGTFFCYANGEGILYYKEK